MEKDRQEIRVSGKYSKLMSAVDGKWEETQQMMLDQLWESACVILNEFVILYIKVFENVFIEAFKAIKAYTPPAITCPE